MRIDELHNLTDSAVAEIESMIKEDMTDKEIEEVEDSILDLLILSYVYGTDDADFILGSAKPPDTKAMEKALYRKIDGKDWKVRVEANLRKPTIIPVITPEGETYGKPTVDVSRIINTETHRIYNEAVTNRGRESGEPLRKTWVTMEDYKVRDSHTYLNEQTVGLDERFYTYDGKSAMYPGDFGYPEEDCNCRCYIKLTR